MGRDSSQWLCLKDARDNAAKCRILVAHKVDPIKHHKKVHRAAVRAVHILNDIAAYAFESRKAELWENGEAGHQWPRLAKPRFAMLSSRSGTPTPPPQRRPITDLPFGFCDPHSPCHRWEHQRAMAALRAKGHSARAAVLSRSVRVFRA